MRKPELNQLFLEALAQDVSWHSEPTAFPLLCDIGPMPALRLRVYLYTVTRQHGGRPQDEYKMQVILPGQQPGVRAALDASDGRIPMLGGYSQDFGAFVFWDASMYVDFTYSRNMQVREMTLASTLSAPIARQERVLRQWVHGERESILASQPRFLTRCLETRALGVAPCMM